jgi:hypothetical protein
MNALAICVFQTSTLAHAHALFRCLSLVPSLCMHLLTRCCEPPFLKMGPLALCESSALCELLDDAARPFVGLFTLFALLAIAPRSPDARGLGAGAALQALRPSCRAATSGLKRCGVARCRVFTCAMQTRGEARVEQRSCHQRPCHQRSCPCRCPCPCHLKPHMCPVYVLVCP